MGRIRRIALAAVLAAGAAVGFAATPPAHAMCQSSPMDTGDYPDPFDRDDNGCMDCPASPLSKLGIEMDCVQ